MIGQIGVSVRLLATSGQEYAEGHVLAAQDALETAWKEMTVVCDSVLTRLVQDLLS